MTKSSHQDDQQPVTTLADTTQDPPEANQGETKTVKLRSPSGAVIETAEDNAELLRGQGFS